MTLKDEERQMKHTPGPWEWRDVWESRAGFNAARLASGEVTVATPNNDTDICVSCADALLIAAAPDLYEALEAIRASGMVCRDATLYHQMMDAINKAESK